MTASASVAPGIWIKMEFVPCCCTDVSEAPRALTRLCTMVVAVAMSLALGVEPSEVDARMITDTPPLISRPWVIFSFTGVKPITETTRTTKRTTRVDR